ncbi:hypothetical protein L218DRAFT_75942 [Marasmius fiardii PR-910]|nr:hypothetical protein L218DRAFT_75942 [Marasmius fiardii PR-910]
MLRKTLRWAPISPSWCLPCVVYRRHYRWLVHSKGRSLASSFIDLTYSLGCLGTAVFGNIWAMTRDETDCPESRVFHPGEISNRVQSL